MNHVAKSSTEARHEGLKTASEIIVPASTFRENPTSTSEKIATYAMLQGQVKERDTSLIRSYRLWYCMSY